MTQHNPLPVLEETQRIQPKVQLLQSVSQEQKVCI